MDGVRTHKDLDVWKKSIEFVTKVYDLTKNFPKEELYGLSSQMRRASISIPSNIAEGATRKNKTEFIQFLYISMSSAAELDTQIIIAKNLNYLDVAKAKLLQDQLDVICRMIQGLKKYISK